MVLSTHRPPDNSWFPQSHTWSPLPSHDAIRGRGGSCLVASADGARLYVLAGFCGHELDDAFCFDLTAGKWDVVSTDRIKWDQIVGITGRA